MGICVSCRRRERKAPAEKCAKGAAAELLSRRPPSRAMANSISNIKMTNPIKGIVSKRKKRYIKDGFNLDLTYITDRLIAMGFPAEKLEGVYRNHIDEVYRFLEQKHRDHYKIYNLCSERTYDYHKFHQRVAVYPFQDHTPPTIDLIQPFCEDVHEWLQAHHENVAAVHCKAGKGRTGTMVCCYLLYSGQKATADEALNYYGTERTHDEKGVTIPSQRRYVSYYAMLVRGGLSYGACSIHIRSITLSPIPLALASHLSAIEIDVRQLEKQPATTVHRTEQCIVVSMSQCTPLSGDVHVQVYAKHKLARREKLFHFWFNTFFVAHGGGAVRVAPLADSPEVETFKLCLNKWELDDAHKDRQNKLYTQDFKVEVIVQKPPSTSGWCGRMLTTRESPESSPESQSSPSSSPASPVSSCDDTDTENDEHWDSGVKANSSSYMWDSQEKTPLCPNANTKCAHKNKYQNKLWSIPTPFADDKNNLQYPTHCEYEAYSIDYTKNLVDTASVSSDVTSTTDASQPCIEKEGKIPKVSSDHMISSIDPDRHVYDTRTCKSPTETNKKKYLFFQSGKKDSIEDRKDDLSSSKPRRSLGDMRASWREFSEKHFGSEHSKDKKKKNGQAVHKDD